jgi:uncharacterized membrane protein HdeD (DUF308 family)
MTDSATVSESITDLGKGVWWWVLIRGIIAVIFGIIALASPAVAFTAITLAFGIYAIVDGIFTFAHAIHARKTLRRWGWLLVQGVVSVIAGIAALVLPGLFGVLGGLVILWTIVIWNVMHGVIGIGSAAGAAAGSAKTWGIIAGVVSILFGILLGILTWVQPGSALLGLIWLIGIYAIIFGVMLVVTAIQVRRHGKKIVDEVTV